MQTHRVRSSGARPGAGEPWSSALWRLLAGASALGLPPFPAGEALAAVEQLLQRTVSLALALPPCGGQWGAPGAPRAEPSPAAPSGVPGVRWAGGKAEL